MTAFDPSRLDPFSLTETDLRQLAERGRRERSLAMRQVFGRIFRRTSSAGF